MVNLKRRCWKHNPNWAKPTIPFILANNPGFLLLRSCKPPKVAALLSTASMLALLRTTCSKQTWTWKRYLGMLRGGARQPASHTTSARSRPSTLHLKARASTGQHSIPPLRSRLQ